MGSSRASYFLQIVASCFFTFHIIAITAWVFPKSTAFGTSLADPFRSYISAFGLWQGWAMFLNRASHNSIEAKIVATDSDGAVYEFDPILPGLKPNNSQVRLNLMWMHGFVPNGKYITSYANRVCAHLRSGPLPNVAYVEVEAHAKMVNELAQAIRTGIAASSRHYSLGKFKC